MRTAHLEITRRAFVAGYFYPDNRKQLKEAIAKLSPPDRSETPAVGLIVPHSTLGRSGRISASVFGTTHIPRKVICIGPSLTGYWSPWSMMRKGRYMTPLGSMEIDAGLAQTLLDKCPFLDEDGHAQEGEHAIEVQIPFLQHFTSFSPDETSLVPILVGCTRKDQIEALALALAEICSESDEAPLLIACSNLAQDEPRDRGEHLDAKLIQTIEDIDIPAIEQLIEKEGLRVTGFPALATLLLATTRLGPCRTNVIRYGHSAESGSDPYAATGYVSARIEKI